MRNLTNGALVNPFIMDPRVREDDKHSVISTKVEIQRVVNPFIMDPHVREDDKHSVISTKVEIQRCGGL